ncbi:serine/arginine repetitive matrix protein 1 [Patella vulgata]|uniref:serine/arginine repetitive matrix protein 1 n=1 Tax=Patella vulgata TaxID=6465 RepID=UPI0021801443|nr:serine/arginine repetitive matrix protein 1 [Patella vulgata]
MCQGDFPHGIHPSQLPPGIHPSQLVLGMDPRQLQEGMHEHQFNPGYYEQEQFNPLDYAPGHLPAEFYESQGLVPPDEVGYFNPPEEVYYPGMPIDEHYVLGPTGIPMSREAFEAYGKQEIEEKEVRAAEWRKRDALVKNGGKLEPINLSKARKSKKKSKSKGTKPKTGNDQSSQGENMYPGSLPPGMHPNHLPPNVHPSQLPQGVHPNQLPPGNHPGQLFPGMHPGQRQQGMHEHQFHPGYYEQEPFNPMDYAPGHLPAEFYESQGLVPPDEVGYFNPPEEEYYPGMPIDEHYVLGPTGIPMSREAFEAYQKDETKQRETRCAEWEKRKALEKNGGRLEPIHLSTARKSKKKSKSTKPKNGKDQPPPPVAGLSPELIANMSPEKKSLWAAINKTLDDNFGPLTPQNMPPPKAAKEVLQVPTESTKDERFTNLMNNLVDPGLKSSKDKFNALLASKTKDETQKKLDEALPTSKSKSSPSDLTKEEKKVIPLEMGSFCNAANASLEDKFGPISPPRLARAPLKANWEPPTSKARAVKPPPLDDNLSPLSPPTLGQAPVNSEPPTNNENAVKQTNSDDNCNPSPPVRIGHKPLKATWKPAISAENIAKPTTLGDGPLSATSSGDVSLKPNWKIPSDDDLDQEKPKTSKYLKSKKALNDLLKPKEVEKEPVSKSQQAINDRLAHLFKKKPVVKSSLNKEPVEQDNPQPPSSQSQPVSKSQQALNDRLAHLFKKKTIVKSSPPSKEPVEQFLDNPQLPSSQSETADQVQQIEEHSSKPKLNFMKTSSRNKSGEQDANQLRPQSPSNQPKKSVNGQPEEKNTKPVFTLGGISPLPNIESDTSNHSLQEVKKELPLKSNKLKLEPLSPSRPKESKLKNKSSTTKSPDTKHKEADISEEKVQKKSKHGKESRKQKKKKPARKKIVNDQAGNTSDDSYPSLNDPCYDI